MQINVPYTLNTYQIHIKLCTWIHFICSSFKPNFKIIRLHIKSYSDFYKCVKKKQSKLNPPQPLKEEKKERRKHESLTIHISWMTIYCKLIKICCVASPRWWAAILQKIVCFFERVTELCMHENCILVLPVNILTVWCASESLAAQHTTVCLYLTR